MSRARQNNKQLNTPNDDELNTPNDDGTGEEVLIELLCEYGDNKPNEKITLSVDKAEQLLSTGWARKV